MAKKRSDRKTDSSGNGFREVLASIKEKRDIKQEPKESLTSLEDFECDLCKGDTPRKGITQCAFCNRWICLERCWNRDYLSCMSCAAIIKLSKEMDGKDKDGEENAEDAGTYKENKKTHVEKEK